jgi:hypothetical protein
MTADKTLEQYLEISFQPFWNPFANHALGNTALGRNQKLFSADNTLLCLLLHGNPKSKISFIIHLKMASKISFNVNCGYMYCGKQNTIAE